MGRAHVVYSHMYISVAQFHHVTVWYIPEPQRSSYVTAYGVYVCTIMVRNPLDQDLPYFGSRSPQSLKGNPSLSGLPGLASKGSR